MGEEADYLIDQMELAQFQYECWIADTTPEYRAQCWYARSWEEEKEMRHMTLEQALEVMHDNR